MFGNRSQGVLGFDSLGYTDDGDGWVRDPAADPRRQKKRGAARHLSDGHRRCRGRGEGAGSRRGGFHQEAFCAEDHAAPHPACSGNLPLALSLGVRGQPPDRGDRGETEKAGKLCGADHADAGPYH